MRSRRLPPALGARGEGWVILQLAVLAAVAGAGLLGAPWPSSAGPWSLVLGPMFAAAGGTLAIAGLRHLGASLTPYPKPGAEAELRVHGAYRLVRHPIYGGLLLVCVGWSLLTSPSALVTSIVLGLVVWGKSMREEAWLLDRYPGYEGYRRQVRRRFLPYVW